VRFDLLLKQYETDLDRLTALEESGSLFAELSIGQCPCCGALPEKQCHESECELDISSTLRAVEQERNKIGRLIRELNNTIDTLNIEKMKLEKVVLHCTDSFNDLELLINDDLSPALLSNGKLLEALIMKSSSVEKQIDARRRIGTMEDQLDSLEGLGAGKKKKKNTKTIIPESSLKMFSAVMKGILNKWDYPNAETVHFNSETKIRDFIIGGKPRASEGKGLRALSYAAFMVGLMEYCRKYRVPHPGVVLLDSPLVAYYEPEGDGDDLRGTKVKDMFTEHLATAYSDRQIIVAENEAPPRCRERNINSIAFTKNASIGRYGFFPPVPNKLI